MPRFRPRRAYRPSVFIGVEGIAGWGVGHLLADDLSQLATVDQRQPGRDVERQAQALGSRLNLLVQCVGGGGCVYPGRMAVGAGDAPIRKQPALIGQWPSAYIAGWAGARTGWAVAASAWINDCPATLADGLTACPAHSTSVGAGRAGSTRQLAGHGQTTYFTARFRRLAIRTHAQALPGRPGWVVVELAAAGDGLPAEVAERGRHGGVRVRRRRSCRNRCPRHPGQRSRR